MNRYSDRLPLRVAIPVWIGMAIVLWGIIYLAICSQ